MLELYPYLENTLKKIVREDYLGAKIRANIGKAWHKNRWIFVSLGSAFAEIDAGLDYGVHYEYHIDVNKNVGLWELHLEYEYGDELGESLKQYLNSKIENSNVYKWHNWNNRQQGRLTLHKDASTPQEWVANLKEIRGYVDPIIEGFCEDRNRQKGQLGNSILNKNMEVPKMSIPRQNMDVESCIRLISEINFQQLRVPEYQRPYKWRAQNVNQLINDIISFCDYPEYRLGTLVLHNNYAKNTYDIVDGQQRIITLTLLLNELLNRPGEKVNVPTEFVANLKLFMQKGIYSDSTSIKNIVNNVAIIKRRMAELADEHINFILNKCSFVVVYLNDISEAFQFFDSQNSRGKDLEPHDLLKAYHLREIVRFDDEDKLRIKYWESIDTRELVDLFLNMYRVKRWSHLKSAMFFTKDDVDIFKGLSLSTKKRYPFYQIMAITHYYIEQYNKSTDRLIDQNRMEFPFQLDQPIINGSHFFDMVKHYEELLKESKRLKYSEQLKDNQIISILDSYSKRHRIGDRYVRMLFNVSVLYYLDKYGQDMIDRMLPKIFVWVYKIRLTQHAVRLRSIDNAARSQDGFFYMLQNSTSVKDVMNWNVSPVYESSVVSRIGEIEDLFKLFNYYECNK